MTPLTLMGKKTQGVRTDLLSTVDKRLLPKHDTLDDPEWERMPNTDVARMARVSHEFVRRIRERTSEKKVSQDATLHPATEPQGDETEEETSTARDGDSDGWEFPDDEPDPQEEEEGTI